MAPLIYFSFCFISSFFVLLLFLQPTDGAVGDRISLRERSWFLPLKLYSKNSNNNNARGEGDEEEEGISSSSASYYRQKGLGLGQNQGLGLGFGQGYGEDELRVQLGAPTIQGFMDRTEDSSLSSRVRENLISF